MLKQAVIYSVACVLFLALVLSLNAAERGGELSIACAANFTETLKRLAAEYEKTGIKVTCVFGSTGMLYGQIINGASYDLFFAADEKRPAMLFDKNIALTPVVYAKGKVVLWSMKKELMNLATWQDVLVSPDIGYVGIPNSKTAPYGTAAEASLRAAKLYTTVEPMLAVGKSVGTAFQYGYTGVADASFIALSQALSEKGMQGKHWDIPDSDAISQSACVLRSGNVEDAQKFMEWMSSREARSILRWFGYE